MNIMKNHAAELTTVQNGSHIGAGRTIPFPATTKTRTVLLPEHAKPSQYYTRTVSGSSLESCGIQDGDILLCKFVHDLSEVRRNTICLITHLPTGEETAKMIKDNGDGTLTLSPSNPFFAGDLVFADEILINGIVVAFQRPLN